MFAENTKQQRINTNNNPLFVQGKGYCNFRVLGLGNTVSLLASWLHVHAEASGARNSQQSVAVQQEHRAIAVGGKKQSRFHFGLSCIGEEWLCAGQARDERKMSTVTDDGTPCSHCAIEVLEFQQPLFPLIFHAPDHLTCLCRSYVSQNNEPVYTHFLTFSLFK